MLESVSRIAPSKAFPRITNSPAGAVSIPLVRRGNRPPGPHPSADEGGELRPEGGADVLEGDAQAEALAEMVESDDSPPHLDDLPFLPLHPEPDRERLHRQRPLREGDVDEGGSAKGDVADQAGALIDHRPVLRVEEGDVRREAGRPPLVRA